MPDDLDAELMRLGELTDGRIRRALSEHMSGPAARFRSMLEYHLGWRGPDLQPLDVPAPAGKKLRPALALLVCRGSSGDEAPALDAAAAVEIVHNFSLVHDDIQDRSELRRHRPTVWSLWGAAQGINAGDVLFALAQTVVLDMPSERSARMAAELNRTAILLAEGQYLDIELQLGATPITAEAYEAMIARKTGALFACACRLGAMAGGTGRDVEEAYADYGLQLGLAFQEQDDLLGVWGLSNETGKPQAADVVERKRGLPAALVLSRADAPGWFSEAYAERNGAMPPELVARV
ncbi:MAG TPA: polyprenyl synthetase family protein, partial [Chloroflexota bacterium]|nr:polyprenyl synthetase family protein [Chloroflexota bacterium]